MVAKRAGFIADVENKIGFKKRLYHKFLILLVAFIVTIYIVLSQFYSTHQYDQMSDNKGVKRAEVNDKNNVSIDTLQKNLNLLSKEVSRIKHFFDESRGTQTGYRGLQNIKVRKLVQSSDDTGVFVHTSLGIDACGRTTQKLLILVIGSFEELSERLLIRETWGKNLRYLNTKEGQRELIWKTLFVVSTPGDDKWPGYKFFETEIKQKGDVVRVEVPQNIHMNGVKYYSALMWALNNCNFKYILITKAQHFVNIPALYEFLHSADLPKTLYAGNFVTKEVLVPKTPINDNRGVWVNKTSMVLESEAVILSYNLVRDNIKDFNLYSNVRPIDPRIMVSEIMDKKDVQPRSISNFVQQTNCTFNKKFILNYEPNYRCYDKLYKQYLAQQKSK